MGPVEARGGFRLVVNRLYYDAAEPASSGFAFDEEILLQALRNIYAKKGKEPTYIEEHLFREFCRGFDRAVAEGFEGVNPDDDFISALRHSNEVFSAFKVHRAQRDMAARLVDSNGNLKPFEQWLKDVQPIASHQCRSWFQTEYDTAVIRAHQAADWKQFERERDVLPNLKWMPSTSANPGADHRPFWGTIRPIDDPFWDQHRPGDRWNCKCSLTSTDEPTTPVPSVAVSQQPKNTPQRGLENNPGKDAAVFSDKHPYFPSDCKHCPFYKPGFKAKLKHLFLNRAKDCNNCPYINGCINNVKEWKIDNIYGERLKISMNADTTELDDNIRTARVLLASFENMKIKIRKHVLEHGISNPEYEINELIADRKGIKNPQGITSAFKKAIRQGCEAVVIDLDKHMGNRHLPVGSLAKFINWRHADFENNIIKECYIIYRGKGVCINSSTQGRETIIKILKELKQ